MSTGTPVPAPPIDVRSLAQIYKSGDLMLQNPAESCVIFVSVILVSALLEWLLQRAGNIENKYARLMAETMSQEITIVGVLALLLMFGTSVIPRDSLQERYVTLFTWANMCLFFMAVFFVTIIMLQFAISTLDLRRWRLFEEGRMDSEELETLSYRERIYKMSFDIYAERIKGIYKLTTSEMPYFEFLGLMTRKYLVKFSDLSYRTWLSLTVVVVANLMRAKLTPFLKKGETTTFSNAMMYVGAIGFGTMFVFLIFFALLQRRILLFCRGGFNPPVSAADAGALVPLGSAKRGIEFVQVISMSTNWYMTLFITGIARDVTTLTGWRTSIVMISFFIPIFVNFFLVPWCIMSITILGTITTAATSAETVDHLVRRLRGEFESDSDADGDDEDGGGGGAASDKASTKQGDRASNAGGGLLGVPEAAGSRGRATSVRSGSDHATTNAAALQRPAWLDDDEFWDGTATTTARNRARADDRLGYLYYENMDEEELARVIKRKNPSLLQGPANPSVTSDPFATAGGGGGQQQQRPIWFEEGDEWDPAYGGGGGNAQ